MNDRTNRSPNAAPAVYGTPEHFARFMESVAKLADREPDETFADLDVRIAVRRLANLLNDRLDKESRA